MVLLCSSGKWDKTSDGLHTLIIERSQTGSISLWDPSAAVTGLPCTEPLHGRAFFSVPAVSACYSDRHDAPILSKKFDTHKTIAKVQLALVYGHEVLGSKWRIPFKIGAWCKACHKIHEAYSFTLAIVTMIAMFFSPYFFSLQVIILSHHCCICTRFSTI